MTQFCNTHAPLQSTETLESRLKQLQQRGQLTPGLQLEAERLQRILKERADGEQIKE